MKPISLCVMCGDAFLLVHLQLDHANNQLGCLCSLTMPGTAIG